MAFRFTSEDFKRYVKKGEHGGRHVWDDLQDQLEVLFGVPFSNAPFIARGDRLQTLWFAPRDTPRSTWANQAQFFLARDIERKQLSFGLMVECSLLSDAVEWGLDQDRDGPRFIQQLERDRDFTSQIYELVGQAGWQIGVVGWSNKKWYTPQSGSELLDILGRLSKSEGWGVHIERVLSAKEAVAAGEGIVAQIVNAYQTVRPFWEAIIPEAVRNFLRKAPEPKQIWLFQANPKYYDLVADLEETNVGDKDSWSVTRYGDEIHAGDIAILWQSGQKAGVYAIGELISDPYQRDWEPSRADLEKRPYSQAEWWVDLCYVRILDRPIFRDALKEHPVLCNLQVLKAPTGTNFRVTPEEWVAMKALIDSGDDGKENNKMLDILSRSFAAQGLYFADWQIATFYTALQAKGFVILSGISGTGKTKLAQHFAALLPQPSSVIPSDATVTQAIAVQSPIALLGAGDPTTFDDVTPPFAYWWSYPIRDDVKAKLTPPFHLYLYHRGRIVRVHTITEFVTQPGDKGITSPWPNITFPREDIGKTASGNNPAVKFKTWCKVGRVTRLDAPIDFSTVRVVLGYQQHISALRNALIPIEDPQPDIDIEYLGFAAPETGPQSNWLFVPVRPDWRDSKSLLGYYNPLTGTYEWTPFLRFLLRAAQSYRVGDGLAWFVILDEMNLAHVEYYFADLLSVLESGRVEGGWSREPLRLIYPDDAQGDLPPRRLHLPPNLYIVGTVNVDETTHAFSPKVLDRAFTLELTEADFSTYLSNSSERIIEPGKDDRQALLDDFTFEGLFTGYGYAEKQPLKEFLANHPEIRANLQSLNGLLQPYNLHFGYRVFDEILLFLEAAERTGIFGELGGLDAALDAAVLMKVLPKFHGSRGKLESPLRAVLAWCMDPFAPQEQAIADILNQVEAGDNVQETLSQLDYRYPATATRACRMLWALYTDGFAAFG